MKPISHFSVAALQVEDFSQIFVAFSEKLNFKYENLQENNLKITNPLILLKKVFFFLKVCSLSFFSIQFQIIICIFFPEDTFCQLFHISNTALKTCQTLKKTHSDITKPQKFQPFNMFLAKKNQQQYENDKTRLYCCALLMTMGEGQTLLNLNEKYLQNYFLDFRKFSGPSQNIWT